jgi:hypothetical protein
MVWRLNKYETGSALFIFVKFMRQKVPAYLLTYEVGSAGVSVVYYVSWKSWVFDLYNYSNVCVKTVKCRPF